MRVKGIKRGQIIELLEAVANLPDGAELIMDIELAPTSQAIVDATEPANTDRLNFVQSLQRFREKYQLEQAGLDPDELFKEVRDHSPVREVNPFD
jgi:cellobiose PTS system EIIB component